MRHVLLDAARARLRAKRNAPMASLTGALATLAAEPAGDAEMVRLGDALTALGQRDPQLAKLVDCRYFAGLDELETAEVLGVTDRTVRRWWTGRAPGSTRKWPPTSARRARAFRRAGSRGLMADHLVAGKPINLHHRVEITDVEGKVLATIPFRELITIVD